MTSGSRQGRAEGEVNGVDVGADGSGADGVEEVRRQTGGGVTGVAVGEGVSEGLCNAGLVASQLLIEDKIGAVSGRGW